MSDARLALVLGATGNIGAEVASRLAQRGWRVRVLHRQPKNVQNPDPRFEWRQGDVMNRPQVVDAAADATLVVHAVNPPGYHNWGGLVMPMLENTIAAARTSNARILLPGTLYNFGPDAFPVVREGAPQNPRTRKGAIRRDLEARLQAAARDGVRSLVVRAGDFFGPGYGSNWFTVLVKPGKPVHSMQYPGPAGVGHQWGYVPDVAETMVQLAEREPSLPAFASYHVGGHWDCDGRQLIDAVRRVTNQPELKVRPFPWWLIYLASPLSEMCRELREMRYLWQVPIRLDDSQLREVLGTIPYTPWDEAVRTTLVAKGCLASNR